MYVNFQGSTYLLIFDGLSPSIRIKDYSLLYLQRLEQNLAP